MDRDPEKLDPDLRHSYEWNLIYGDATGVEYQFVVQVDRDRRRDGTGAHPLMRPSRHVAQSELLPVDPPGYLRTQADDLAVAQAKETPAEDAPAAVEDAAPVKAPAKRAPRKQAE